MKNKIKWIISIVLAAALMTAPTALAAEDGGSWEADTEYTDWQWWLARTEEGGFELLTWGNG